MRPRISRRPASSSTGWSSGGGPAKGGPACGPARSPGVCRSSWLGGGAGSLGGGAGSVRGGSGGAAASVSTAAGSRSRSAAPISLSMSASSAVSLRAPRLGSPDGLGDPGGTSRGAPGDDLGGSAGGAAGGVSVSYVCADFSGGRSGRSPTPPASGPGGPDTGGPGVGGSDAGGSGAGGPGVGGPGVGGVCTDGVDAGTANMGGAGFGGAVKRSIIACVRRHNVWSCWRNTCSRCSISRMWRSSSMNWSMRWLSRELSRSRRLNSIFWNSTTSGSDGSSGSGAAGPLLEAPWSGRWSGPQFGAGLSGACSVRLNAVCSVSVRAVRPA